MSRTSNDIPINKGSPKLDFGNGGIVAFVGKTGSGKTQRLRHILKHNYKQFNYLMVMCPKGTGRDDYDFIEKEFIKEYSEELLTKIVDVHEEIHETTGSYLRGGIIIDDCMNEANATNSETFSKLAIRARKLGLTIFFLVQYFNTKTTTPLLRSASNYIFMTSAVGTECKIMREAVGSSLSLAVFTSMCQQYVRNYSCLMFDNRGGSNNGTVCYPPYNCGKYKLRNFSQ